MKKTLLVSVVLAIIVGLGVFYAGMQYGKNKNFSSNSNFRNSTFQQRQQRMLEGRFGRMGNGQSTMNFASGEIISKDKKSITIKLRDGGSKIIFFSDSTQIMKSTKGAEKDLEIGKVVMVNGEANADGSINAEIIQIRPDNLRR